MGKLTGYPVVDAIAQINFKGDITPKSWYKHICYQTERSGEKTDHLAVHILALLVNDLVGIGIKFDSIPEVEFQLSTSLLNYIADELSTTDRVAKESVKTLEDCGVIARSAQLSPAKIREILTGKTPSLSLCSYQSSCEWCKTNTPILHKHHYPIKKSNGGTETVSICPNCHAEFHWMLDTPKYQFTQRLIDITYPVEVCNG